MGKRVQKESRQHAIVIGASMGGLSAAAALAPFYERVTVLERDAVPDKPEHRRGVPQSKHGHGLQPGGVRALEVLLPGVLAELTGAGVPTGDLNGSCTWTIGGSTLARDTIGVPGIGVTRPFLEHHVRTRVAALPNVTIQAGMQVDGLLTSGPDRVSGLTVDSTVGGTEQLAADLVVDATGKVSKLPHWLTAIGYDAPLEESVRCKVSYVSRRWQLADPSPHADLVTVITPAETPQFGVMIAQEDGTHIVTLGGLLDRAPARGDDAFLAFAGQLPNQAIADALVGATPVTDLQRMHFPASRRRRYDKLRSFPAGLLALGDSIASFNPMYGQGMTVAALEAVALRDSLSRGPLDARAFFAKAHRIEDVAWKIAAGGDLRFEDVEGKRTPDMKIMNRYLDKLTAAARTDPVLARQFLLVAGFIERPETFFKPSIVWRVLTGGRRARPVTVAAPVPQGDPAAA
jgi:2-polyprenyl-6-methoxyphenol hydroxylase-like FAD-dependent oxidoreductase